MSDICKTIELFLKKYELDKSDLSYIVAFSGGYDSLCLLDSLKKITKNRIIAIHLNHNWRGEESNQEEANCKKICEELGIDFYSETLSADVAHTETAARAARYDFFERCAKKFDSRVIFTAHNQNDNAETLIYRICMGTGVRGLQGISENRGIFYRPLLNISRADIENYCKENKLNPNNDSSNSNTKYKRNFIRTKILPLLLEINPNTFDAVNSLSTVAKEENEIVTEYINNILEKITVDEKISTKEFLKLSAAIQKRIIYEIFIKNNLDYDRKKILKIWKFIKENSENKSGKTTSLTDNLWIFVNENYVEIISKFDNTQPVFFIEKEGKLETENWIFEITKFDKPVENFPPDDSCCAYVNLKDFPLELRYRKDGDIIKPLGLKGTQKLKKYLNEKKIPNHEKDRLMFLTRKNEVLWAIGLGISDKIKVEKNASHKLTFIRKRADKWK